jgi:serine/threonine protein phosphatase PrpC
MKKSLQGQGQPGGSPVNPEKIEPRASMDWLISKHFAPSPSPIKIEFGALSHPGKVRENNEDHYLVTRRSRSRQVLMSNLPDGYLPVTADDDAYVIVVADGLGGEAFGELASKLAIRTAWDLSLSEIKWTVKVSEREVDELKEKAELYFQLIDRALIQEGQVKPQAAGMGTTLTFAYTIGSNAFVFHVGDSRAYLFRGDRLTRLTRDHTVAQRLVDAGLLTPESVAASSFRNMLTNCVGCSKEGVKVEMRHARIEDGDALLICSDGLTDMVDEEAMSRTLGSHSNPQDACQALLAQALDKGGKDNITMVLARYSIPEREKDQ